MDLEVRLMQTTTRDIGFWLLSAVGGVLAALGFVTLGVRGLAVALLLALVVVYGQRRALKAGGALAGAGAAILVIRHTRHLSMPGVLDATSGRAALRRVSTSRCPS